jgi:5-methylcytosine-specific restriction endonuclease McrA
LHHPPGWKPYEAPARVRTDAADRFYGTAKWRRLAKLVIYLADGICAICQRPGADLADHILERRKGGQDNLDNLRAVHRSCHSRRHAWGKEA